MKYLLIPMLALAMLVAGCGAKPADESADGVGDALKTNEPAEVDATAPDAKPEPAPTDCGPGG
ncbi:MAG: hypothetical protein HN909_01045 [Phycisphaerales bacterium]|jgi:hypothetical protein|nr:hypothetical protein [Phycisphaerales bacterium]MBT7170335.1 hypothetical protein [Phycisphaerales bacterium]